MQALGNPHLGMGPVIHVAGTNGKGSTTAFLRAMAEAAGLRVHVLTSPHLVRFAERIRIAGRLISDDELSRRIDEVEAANAGEAISFFEITTALAFHAFAQTPADLVVVEVGLGGRFDATNVFPAPAVSVITPIDYDHLEMLGPELNKIAWEKAGIVKRHCPVVSARQRDEALTVIEAEAAALVAPLTLMGRDFDAHQSAGRLTVTLEDRLLDLPLPSLPGEHQHDNAALAAVALLKLNDPRIDEAAIARGVTGARWPGRFQRLTAGPLGEIARNAGADLWLDGGHNPHGARALAKACARMSARDGRPWTLVVGLLGRKDALGFFEALTPLEPRVIAVPFSSPNATAPQILAAAAKAAGLEASIQGDVLTASKVALAGDRPPHVMVCGSLHFVGDVLAMDPATWPT